MTRRLDVSVLICTRDRSALLEGCLESVLACSPSPAEVVVVDQSQAQATRLAVGRRQGAVVPVRYVRGIGTGLSRAKNQGIADCAAAVVAFTDDDCLVDSKWVEALSGPIVTGRAEAVVGRTLPEKGVGGLEETSSVYAPEGCRSSRGGLTRGASAEEPTSPPLATFCGGRARSMNGLDRELRSRARRTWT